MVVVNTEAGLKDAVMVAKAKGQRMHILGGGTNMYFADHLNNFLIIKNEIKGIKIETQTSVTPTDMHTDNSNSVLVTASAGEVWDDVVHFAAEKNLWGIENLSYIPGTVGAAPVQNIGAYGSSLSDVFVSLSALDTDTLNLVEIAGEACDFGYRDSIFKHQKGKYIIISVSMKLSKTAKPVLNYKPLDSLQDRENLTIQDVRDVVIATRKAKLPNYHEYPNTGSFFKNPVITDAQADTLKVQYPDIKLIKQREGYKVPAAWLIEHVAAYKGVRIGDVGTWPNQPLVIVNYGQATAEQVLDFSDGIVEKVKEKTGIMLEQEVHFVE